MKNDSVHSILVINPGGTSTRVSLYRNEVELFTENVRHDHADLERFEGVYDQLEWRLATVRRLLEEREVPVRDLDAVVGRGPPLVPVPSGTFTVDRPMLKAIEEGRVLVHHPSLLGAPITDVLAREAGCPAYIVDPVTVDEMLDEARLTGLPEVPRRPLSHALSVKAVSRLAARELGRPLAEVNLIVLHLGSGFTVAAQRGGRQVDHNDPTATGPMAPTRAGALPTLDMARLCFAEGVSLAQLEQRVVENGGWSAHLGTDDVREIYRRVDKGDASARLVLDATLHQLNREVGSLYAVLDGRLDGIALTGGVVRCEVFVGELERRIAWTGAPVMIFPGENEMEALALGALRVLRGECPARKMPLGG